MKAILNLIKPLIAYAHQVSNNKTENDFYEFCPNCEANLTFQKGYQNDLSYWICKGCGKLLLNPSVPGTIAWICDKCDTLLNIQEGFTEDCKQWNCKKCGHNNIIDLAETYESEEEYLLEKSNPYKGLTDKEVLELSMYNEESFINGRSDIILVREIRTKKLYVKKILSNYNSGVYRYLKKYPVMNIPKIKGIYDGTNKLIVIEEYIDGSTLLDILNEKPLEINQAVVYMKEICNIVIQLHSLDKPIIHRDIKPSNIIITPDKHVYLIDLNVAKWYQEDEIEDTILLGTKHYAAPEQLGYGLFASSIKSDVYALGVLLNVMVTGKYPKEEKAPEEVWNIVEKCICLEPDKRLSDVELLEMLTNIQE